MHWFNVTAAGTRDTIAGLEQWFWDRGAVSVTVENASETTAIYEPGPGEQPLWNEVLVTGLFESDIETDNFETLLGESGYQLKSIDKLQDRPWEREWLNRFSPMKFGDRIWICPTGYELDEHEKVVVHLDPGLAFGTGTHETTRLMLEFIDRCNLQDKRVLDFGCGSGVLAIAAALLGASEVTAVDTDPQAITATHENARGNSVEINSFVVGAESISPVNLLLANILAGPLVELANELIGLVRPGGRLVLSGIMQSQCDWVSAAYERDLMLLETAELNGWIRMAWKKP